MMRRPHPEGGLGAIRVEVRGLAAHGSTPWLGDNAILKSHDVFRRIETLPFSRDNESEADKLGVDYMRAAGYDVKQSVKLWEKMGAASGSRSPEFMSTHPNPDTRIKDLKAYITAKGYATF